MRLMIIGSLNGQLSTATKMAMDRGAQVTHAPTLECAMRDLRSGRGADLLMVDVIQDIAALLASLEAERICAPVVACGVDQVQRVVVEAIDDGCRAVRARDLVRLLARKALVVVGSKPAVEADTVGDHQDHVPGAMLLRERGHGEGAREGSREKQSRSRHYVTFPVR